MAELPASIMRGRMRLAFWLCPELKDELDVLRSANTKVVLENQRLWDEVELWQNSSPVTQAQRLPSSQEQAS